MDESNIERLINQCRSNDVDVRVDAVTKLQVEFEAGVDIPDADALITVLKACLRTPNQHLSTATLSAFPPLLPLLISRFASHGGLNASSSISPAASTSSIQSSVVDVHTLRQVLMALLPAGGVIDRLGDSREKAREKARETLVILGGLAFRGGGGSTMVKSREGKGPETPLMLFERFVREVGLASKVWRVREQIILTLVHIRRVHHLFPIRPYLPALVEALEDPDATVRGTTQTSVVELFTGPAVSDAARADLKKELTKKGVRKGIVESVLSKVLAGGSSTPQTGSDAGSENGDAATVNVPPSIALMNKRSGPNATVSGPSKSSPNLMGSREPSRPASRAAAVASPAPDATGASGNADIKPVYIASSRDLENEFASMLKHFEGKETEHNWAPREQAILRVRGMLKGEVHERFTETFYLGLKGFIDASIKAVFSLRTTVAANTCSLYVELATILGINLEPFCDTLYHNLLRMASLTKKIIAQQSQATVSTIISNTSGQPRLLLPILWSTLQDKATQPRVYAMGHVKTFLGAHAARSRQSIESAGGVDILEKSIKKGLSDPNPSVKEQARHCFWLFDSVWKDRGRIIFDALDNLSRKQLEKVCPNPEVIQAVPPSTPQTKKSSVAAAIAASRAKAKAIATAPPTLRHQATSAARTTSPPTKRAISPSLSSSSSLGGSVRATSPISRVASSSSPPRARIVSAGGGLSRSTSAGFIPTTHSRDASSRGKAPASPPSPTPNSSFHRRISSPLVATPTSTSNSTLRRAVETALPASPPPQPSMLHGSPTPRPESMKAAVPAFHRESINITGFNVSQESLLLASNIPIPEDNDSDMDMDMDGDESLNLISFSTPYERYPPRSTASFSPRSSSSKPAASNALSTATSSPPSDSVPQPMVEDAMRARAEQAESAAERLLELVEPDEENTLGSSLPASLLLGSAQATPRLKTKTPATGHTYPVRAAPVLPRTPVSKPDATAIFRKAALFQDSPAPRNGGPTPSVFDMIDTRTVHSDWWTKRISVMNQTVSQFTAEPSDRRVELNTCVSALEKGIADAQVLKKLALLCRENAVNEPISPISPGLSDPLSPSPPFGKPQSVLLLKSDLWTQDKTFDRLFNALVRLLDTSKNSNDLEYGLIVLWEMLENQALFLEGREADIFAVLLRIRYCGLASIFQATITFRDTLTARIEPVYGLTTMHATVRAFRDSSLPLESTAETKDGTYAFGLIALGKFMLRLPAEVLEDELPRLKATLIAALTDNSTESSTVVREAAAASIIAAQLVIQDETHVFTLLDGLPEDKKNLLAYLFDKHSTRGANGSGIDKLGKEILRLDNRTSTPPRKTPLQSPIVLS